MTTQTLPKLDHDECQHVHTYTDSTHSTHCRYIPSSWERDDDDPFETVTVTDTYVYCSDCGELLECLCGD
jgi:hypothetical protein